jgi:hypothetical protein
MHAWSAVQHALDYKGEWDVPENLKKDINALSALFYVADTEFASVYAAREATLHRVTNEASADQGRDEPLNLDTLRAYAAETFPDRWQPAAGVYSELVQQLLEAGYATIGQVDRDVRRAEAALDLDEKQRRASYNAVGAIRISAGIASPEFRKIAYPGDGTFPKSVLDKVKPE